MSTIGIIMTVTATVLALLGLLLFVITRILGNAAYQSRLIDLCSEAHLARERGDTAMADQLEAEMRELRGPGGAHLDVVSTWGGELDQQS